MSRENLTLFTIFFLIIFGFGSSIVVLGLYEEPEEEKTFVGTLNNIVSSFKKFYVDIPVFGSVILTLISALGIYVLYREVRGGL